LDGLWQLLRQAPSLLHSQPKLLAAVMRVLSTLWECQGAAHGAVELLRGQKDFWTAFKVSMVLYIVVLVAVCLIYTLLPSSLLPSSPESLRRTV
jgi:hypothetical protein